MKEGWEVKKLGEIYDVRDGTHDSPKYVKRGFPLITSKNLKNGIIVMDKFNFINEDDYNNINKRSKVHVGDVLFAMIGTIGNPVVIIDEPTYAIKNVALFKIPKNQNSYFLKYFLDSEKVIKKLTNESKGATQKFVSLNYLRNFSIPLPPLSKQNRIVSILDEAFAAIDKAKANAEKNLKNAKELFESYLQSVFENKGEGWEEKRLGDLVNKTETIDPTKNPSIEILYIDVSSVNKESKKIETVSKLLGKDAPSRARKLIKKDDVIFATVRPTHSRVAIITEEFNEQVCSTGYMVLRVKETLLSRLLFYFLLTKSFNKQMEKLQKGASYPAVIDNDIKSQKINFPKSINEQHKLVSILDLLSIECQKLETLYQKKIESLEELKKSLLQKAFSGELKVSESELAEL